MSLACPGTYRGVQLVPANCKVSGIPIRFDPADSFRRQGQPCEVYGMPIVRTKVAGLPTNFCPHCQKSHE